MQACACRKVAESSRRKCPNCQHVEATAVPFTRSGVEYTVCREHDKPVPILTELAKAHFVDERGYMCCVACGFVFEDFSGELETRFVSTKYDSDHYARLVQREAGFLPRKYGSSGRRYDDLVLNPGRRPFIRRSARALEDAEILCSLCEISGDTKLIVLAAVEAWRESVSPETRSIRHEAALIAICECTVSSCRGQFDSAKAIRAFNVSNDQIARARKGVGRWFETYWKGDKR